MKNTITIANIAEKLSLSRNTVSKALNGQYVKPKTKQLIIKTAIEMGYKSYDIISTNTDVMQKRILILSSVPLMTQNYYIYLLKGIVNEAERIGYEVVQYVFKNNNNIDALKNYINQFEVNGIICIEFFTEKIFTEIVNLGYPTVFLDYPTANSNLEGNFDIVLSEAILSVSTACSKLIKAGAKKFCFFGDPNNCRSFYERFLGMKEALFLNNLKFDINYSILNNNAKLLGSTQLLANKIKSLPSMPDCFVCANDFTAIKLIQSLTFLKEDLSKINIIGYDNSPESKMTTPQLSTINVDKVNLGKQTITLLTNRIQSSKTSPRILYVKTNFIERQSTPLLGG